ncbi:predicted protein [Arabidopsis lyrata subsp. lyrata]|uniref:Predicted protein n=1 Tax=Arabidopsis lyrata subsp. lyrata TaxID=81972 RepID=D7M9S8_ARALL|nr:predicted protein [Arabidopsis lyrata subsp. lyrata]
MPITHIAPAPHPRDGYYSTNNPYQVNGPKGFTEFKYLEETHDLFVRLDFPGIKKESVIILLEPLKKAVIVTGDAPKESKHDSSHRKYGTATGLICDCCEISNIQCFVGDGVVRLILSKKKINLRVPNFCSCKIINLQMFFFFSFFFLSFLSEVQECLLMLLLTSFVAITQKKLAFVDLYSIVPDIFHGFVLIPIVAVAGGHPLAHLRGLNREGCRGTDPFDPAFTGPTILPHPSVLEGSTSAYETKQLSNGGLYLRIDMPGVPSGRFMVAVDGDGVVTIMGRAPATMHDTNGYYTMNNPYQANGPKGFTEFKYLEETHDLFVRLDFPGVKKEKGFYAINNQFLATGPKGFMEFKMLENEDMFVRIDFPGVPKDGVRVFLDQSKKAVCIFAEAPKEHKYDYSERNYGTSTGLVCKCCEVSGFTSLMCDGVLRLILTKSNITPQRSSCISFLAGPDFREDLRGDGPHKFPHGTDPNADPKLTGRILMPHPCVNYGSEMAYESKQLQNGGLYVRVDMPGVPKENFTVAVMNRRVKVAGEAPAVSHDSSGRFYSGDVAMLSTPFDIPIRKIKIIAKNGVIRLIIPPV